MKTTPGFHIWATCAACKTLLDPQPDVHYPHGYQCPGCGGFVDVRVTFDDDGEHNCGAIQDKAGTRCGERIPPGQVICQPCMYKASLQYVETEQGRSIMAALLAEQDIEAGRRATKARRDAETAARREAEAVAGNTARHVVYYCRLGANHIKIGTTMDLPRRMVELRVVNASNLLAAEPGGYDVEHQRHEQFRKWRYQKRKEDFGEGPDLLDHIRAVRSQHGDPYALATHLGAPTTPGVP